MVRNYNRENKEIDLNDVEIKEEDFPQVYKLIRKEQEND